MRPAERRAIGGDLPVRRLGFGALRLTGPDHWGPPADPAAARRLLRRAVELGVELIDTAESYGPHVSETLIAEALHPYPEGLVIATKGGLDRRDAAGEWTPNGRPERLIAACLGSLGRLRVEQIGLYQLHRFDPAVPEDEQLGALAELVRQGRIRHVGLSGVSVEQLERARRALPIASVQNRYGVADRRSEALVEACERLDVTFIAYAPLLSARNGGAHEAVARVARRHGATAAQVALAWVLARSGGMVAIPGTGSMAHLEENMGAGRLALDEDDLAALAAGGPGKE